MNKWKIAFWCCLTLLVAVTLFSVHSIIDQGVTLTYQKEGYTDTENDLDQLIEIINKTDLALDEVIGVCLGSVLVFGDAKLIYYEAEGPNDRWITKTIYREY